MADETGISWADSTMNPWVGCAKVSPGCANCYAETLVTGRMGRAGTWGDEGVRQRTSAAIWDRPLAWERQAEAFAAEHGGRRRRVFCASLADVFEPRPELVPWRLELFDLIARTPSLDWLILTKRLEEARDFMLRYYVENRPLRMRDDEGRLWVHGPSEREWANRDRLDWGVLPNVWIGTSIENARFTWRADVLREIPARVRFISAEPLLGSLFKIAPSRSEPTQARVPADEGALEGGPGARGRAPLDLTGIDWVIVGGESGGRSARPMHPAWAREIRDAVLALGQRDLDEAFWLGAPDDVLSEGVRDEMIGRDRPALHMKQHGSWRPAREGERPDYSFPDGQGMVYAGAGPSSGGKYLDGVDWCETPTSPTAVLA